jgi:hypothetical protein
VEVHMILVVQHHLHEPQAGRAAGHMQYNAVGLLPNRRSMRSLSQSMSTWMATPKSK